MRDKDETLRSCIGLVIKHLYLGKRPPDSVIRTEASIAKALGERYGYDRLALAIIGLARRRERGDLSRWMGQRHALSLRWLNSKKFMINQLAASEDEYYKADAPAGHRAPHSEVVDIGSIISKIRSA